MDVKIFDISGQEPIEGSVPADQVQTAISSGKYSLPKGEVDVVSPDGQQGTIPSDQAPQAFKAGYKYASPTLLKELKNDTLSSKASSFAQGVGQGFAGPLATGAQLVAGDSKEAIRERKEAHPLLHGLGEVTGLLGSAASGVGEARLLAGAAGLVSKGAAKKVAIENALYTAGDEISKMMVEDPHQSAESALLNVGLSGALGGVFGKVANKLSKIDETRAGKFLSQFKDRVGQHMDPLVGTDALPPLGAGGKLADSLIEQGVGKISGGAVGAGAGALVGGHTGAVVGGILGEKYLDKIIPGMAKSLLKNETSSKAYVAATEYAANLIKGQTLLNKAADSIFKVASSGDYNTLSDDKHQSDIKGHLENLRTDITKLMDKGTPIAHYLPDHAGAVTETMGRIVTYLDTLKPSTDRATPLDPERTPSKVEEGRFNRALDLAEQPLLVTQSIKEGSLTPFDIQSIQTMYPQVTNTLRGKMLEAMTRHLSADQGNKVPYSTLMGLSLFFGIPLESSTLPQNIMALQQTSLPAPPPIQRSPGLPESKAQGIKQLPQLSALPGQARELNRQSPTRK